MKHIRKRACVTPFLALAIFSFLSCDSTPVSDESASAVGDFQLVVGGRSSTTTTEWGDEVTLTVALSARPKSSVVVRVASTDATEGDVAPPELTFTESNWSSPQIVLVRGEDDPIPDGSQSYRVEFGPSVSSDSRFHGIEATSPELTNLDDETPSVLVEGPSGTTSEGGATATLSVRLGSRPSANVVLSLASSDTTEGTIAPATLTFTSSSWNAPQTVTVTGVDDSAADGPVDYTVAVTDIASSDGKYAQLAPPPPVTITNVDDDTPGITAGFVYWEPATEAGGATQFAVVLHSEPTSDVTLSFHSSDTSEGVPSITSVTFTPANWSSPQLVTVTGQDDPTADGNQPYEIVFDAPVSEDPEYANLAAPESLALTNTDDESAGIAVFAPSGLTTSEAGGTAPFMVALHSQPTAGVTITLVSSQPDEGTPMPASLTFTETNWASPQLVSVHGNNDTIADGSQVYAINFGAVQSDDATYASLAPPPGIEITNTDDDSPGILLSRVDGLVTTESGGADTFSITLASEPTASVTLTYASNRPSEGVAAPASVVFTPSDWNTPHVVTVTGTDDHLIDGNAVYAIVFEAPASTDAGYAALAAPTGVSVTNTDDDTAGITLVQPLLPRTTEIGGSTSFGMVLNAQPESDVVVAVRSSNEAEGVVGTTSVTFTPSDWSTVHSVTVTGQDDALADGNATYAIVFDAPSSADANHAALSAPPSISLSNIDNDVAAPIATDRVNTRMAFSSQTTVSYGGYLNGESFQQEGILTYDGYQYAAYWNTGPRVVLARRPVGTGSWSKIEMAPSYTGTSSDAHNTISLGISPSDGRLHIAFDHHSSDLHYVRSVAGLVTNPATATWGTTSFSSVSSILGTEFVNLVTYPRFITAPSGKMLLSYRYGTSGSGDEVLWEYDGSTGTWTKIGTWISGIPDSVNAYLHSIEYNDTRLHAAWCWRDTPDASTNQDLTYVYSDDHGRTWSNNAGMLVGTTGASPITQSSDVRVWVIGQNRGLINQEHMIVDNAGRVHVLLSHMPDSQADDSNFTRARTKSLWFHYYRDVSGVWTRVPMNIPVSANFRGKFAVSSTNNLYAVLPNLRIASASASAFWTNWTVIETAYNGSFFSDPLIDRYQLRTSNTLTVFAPTVNTGGIVYIDTINYTIY
jgi:hypothetical protein